jgi:hypothetical protein
MTIATLLFTSLVFLLMGRAGAEERIVALTVGAIVCVAAANAGNTSQDLKTGFIIGATPSRQQLGLMIGAITSAIVVGYSLLYLNDEAMNLLPRDYPSYSASASEVGEVWNEKPRTEDGKTYRVLRLPVEADAGDGVTKIPAGKYLVGDDGKIHYLVNPGIGGIREALSKDSISDISGESFLPGNNVKAAGTSRGMDDQMYQRVIVSGRGPTDRTLLVNDQGVPAYEIVPMQSKLDAPKAALMGILVDGVLTQKLPWSLILIGAFISITLEIMGLHALPIAVGIYLPISTSATIFVGGLVRSIVNRMTRGEQTLTEEETGKGVLLSSGLIAGGAIGGLFVAFVRAGVGSEEKLGIGSHLPTTSGALADILSLIIFALLVGYLFRVARRRSNTSSG